MMKTLENTLKKHWFNITVVLLVYPTWVVCDLAGTVGRKMSEQEKKESVKEYRESGKLYKIFRAGHYLGIGSNLEHTNN